MHNYNYPIECLKREQEKLLNGYNYISGSPLSGTEEIEALSKVKLRLKRIEQAIETLNFLQYGQAINE